MEPGKRVNPKLGIHLYSIGRNANDHTSESFGTYFAYE